jgi:hypothetical protein
MTEVSPRDRSCVMEIVREMHLSGTLFDDVLEKASLVIARHLKRELIHLTSALHRHQCHPDYVYRTCQNPAIVDMLKREGWEQNVSVEIPGDSWRRKR